MDAQRRKLAAEITASVESDKRAKELQAARDADIEKVRSYYLERTGSAQGFQVTKKRHRASNESRARADIHRNFRLLSFC